MADNDSNNAGQDIQQVIENNQKLAQIAQNQADVMGELRQMNSDKDLKIAELTATIKRIQNQIAKAQESQIDDVDTEFEEVEDDEGSEDEQE